MVRNRRTKSYWEPFFDSTTPDTFVDHTWNFEHTTGVSFSTFRPENLASGSVKIISEVSFVNCDFQGDFSGKPLVFKNCHFKLCDFGLSTFQRAKFNKCKFEKSSFTQCTLNNCDFQNCDFHDISYSGNETQLAGTFFSNPDKFVNAGRTNTKRLPSHISRITQWLRFSETKSSMSRAILASHEKEGSDRAFYLAVKVVALQSSKSRISTNALSVWTSVRDIANSVRSLLARRPISEPTFDDKSMSLIGSVLNATLGLVSLMVSTVELLVIYFFGIINGWGSSAGRAIVIGGMFLFGFAGFYTIRSGISFSEALRDSAEIMLLFGYTNHSPSSLPDVTKVVFANAITGVAWYVVTVPTIVNRITRLRG